MPRGHAVHACRKKNANGGHVRPRLSGITIAMHIYPGDIERPVRRDRRRKRPAPPGSARNRHLAARHRHRGLCTVLCFSRAAVWRAPRLSWDLSRAWAHQCRGPACGPGPTEPPLGNSVGPRFEARFCPSGPSGLAPSGADRGYQPTSRRGSWCLDPRPLDRCHRNWHPRRRS
jgi:hypothetical protein